MVKKETNDERNEIMRRNKTNHVLQFMKRSIVYQAKLEV